MAALEMLNIMEQFHPDKDGPKGTAEVHKRIEAMKLAYADLYRYNADPRFAKVPVAGLLDKSYAAQRAAKIDVNKANCDPGAGRPSTSDTTYLAVVDKDGNIASLIQSNYSAFGSGVVVNGMGFALQNLQPRKRPFHTIIPAFMERGDVHVGFGIMGGANQPLAHAQFVSNFVDYGMNIQAALEAPRFTVTNNQPSCEIMIESRVPPEVLQALRQKGHNLIVRAEYTAKMGRGQAVIHNSKTGMNFAASDPRADGVAEPEPIH
jgi:gamma-glutamyltranspeptidase/glutathione hydrolase